MLYPVDTYKESCYTKSLDSVNVVDYRKYDEQSGSLL